jgi:ParB/RepB/Spo0J family partition protein
MNAPDAVPCIVMLPVGQIVKSPTNPRKHINEAALQDLANSIKEQGLIQPITVRKWDVGMTMPPKSCFGDMVGIHELVAGERRWRAATMAGLSEIPAIVRILTDVQVMEIQTIENLQREDVHPIEEAEGYERLMKEAGYTADSLGEKVGKSRGYIYARLKLLALAPAARELFYDGKLTASTALLIARIPGAKLQLKAAAEITKPNWQGEIPSYRVAAQLIQSSYCLDLDRASFKLDDAKLVPEVGSCVECPKRSGNDRVLFADIDGENVCTDPQCFDNKREVNYLRLRAVAEKSGKEVIVGDDAKKMLASGTYSLRQFNLESLDTRCPDDPEKRTFREILGQDAAATTLVEDPRNKTFVEAIDNKALAAALKKAGITRDVGQVPQQRDWEAERQKREAKAKIENAWRAGLFQAVRIKLGERFAESKVLAPEELTLLAVNLFQRIAANDGNNIEEIMTLWGHPPAEDSDDYEAEINAFVDFLITLSAAELCLFLIDISLIDEASATPYAIEQGDQPTRLLAQAKRLGIDPDALRDPPIETAKPVVKAKKATGKADAKPTSTPYPAAQAQKQGAPKPAAPAKPKGKNRTSAAAEPKPDPAPATPANEPAAPVAFPAWPFPEVKS